MQFNRAARRKSTDYATCKFHVKHTAMTADGRLHPVGMQNIMVSRRVRKGRGESRYSDQTIFPTGRAARWGREHCDRLRVALLPSPTRRKTLLCRDRRWVGFHHEGREEPRRFRPERSAHNSPGQAVLRAVPGLRLLAKNHDRPEGAEHVSQMWHQKAWGQFDFAPALAVRCRKMQPFQGVPSSICKCHPVIRFESARHFSHRRESFWDH